MSSIVSLNLFFIENARLFMKPGTVRGRESHWQLCAEDLDLELSDNEEERNDILFTVSYQGRQYLKPTETGCLGITLSGTLMTMFLKIILNWSKPMRSLSRYHFIPLLKKYKPSLECLCTLASLGSPLLRMYWTAKTRRRDSHSLRCCKVVATGPDSPDLTGFPSIYSHLIIVLINVWFCLMTSS